MFYRINAGGPALASTDGGPAWQSDSSSTSPYRNSGSSASTTASTLPQDASVPASTPAAIFSSDRWDGSTAPEMQWAFPVSAGTPTTVRLYFANTYSGTSTPGKRVFDVAVEGTMVLNDFDIVASSGNLMGTMRDTSVVSDGTINIDFAHVIENPLVTGIEILRTTTGPGSSGPNDLASWSFDGSSTGPQNTSTTSIDWSTVRGAFTVGNKLYFGASNGMLKVAPFDGLTIGTPADVNPYHDPRWMFENNGSGGTYDGVTPTFYGQISAVRGMTYSAGRLWYTDGGSTLKGLKFSPDSGIVEGVAPIAAASSLSFADVGELFTAGSTLYYVLRSTGDLWSIGWTGTATTGTAVRVSGPSTGGPNWSGRALFLGNPPANQVPVAAFTTQCTGLTCHFDGAQSADSDGTITGYAWDFGDGTTSTDAVVDHTYASGGSVPVSLTVTDDDGASSSHTETAEPVDTPAGTGFIDRASTTDAFTVAKELVVPAAVTASDTLVLTWSGDPASVPADPAGWTKIQSIASGTSFAMVVWSRQADGSEGGTTVTLTQPVAKRSVAQLLVYRGFSQVATSGFSLDSATAAHTAPGVPVNSGDLVVHIFGDRSATTSAWSAGAPDTARGSVVGTTTTRFSVFASDPTLRSSAGTAAASTATTDSVSTKGAGISVALRP